MYDIRHYIGDTFYTFLIASHQRGSDVNEICDFTIGVSRLQLKEIRIGRVSSDPDNFYSYGPDVNSEISYLFDEEKAFSPVTGEPYLIGHNKFLGVFPLRAYPRISQLFQTMDGSKPYTQEIVDIIHEVIGDKVGRIHFLDNFVKEKSN